MVVILIVFEWLLIWLLCKWKVLPSEISKYLFEMLQCLIQVMEKFMFLMFLSHPVELLIQNTSTWPNDCIVCLSVCLSVRLPFCVCLSVCLSVSGALRTGSSCFACAA